MRKFKVGDRVVHIERRHYGIGTIKGFEDDCYAVEFDNQTSLHECGGLCTNGKGWWVLTHKLELVEEQESNTPFITEKEGQVQDMVNHPDHYTVGGIETIDFIQAKLSPEAFKGYLTGNILKYITRFQHKNGLEDLKKAQWYLNKLIGGMADE